MRLSIAGVFLVALLTGCATDSVQTDLEAALVSDLRDRAAGLDREAQLLLERVTDVSSREGLFRILATLPQTGRTGVEVLSARGELLAWWGDLPPAGCSRLCFEATRAHLSAMREAPGSGIRVIVSSSADLQRPDDLLSPRLHGRIERLASSRAAVEDEKSQVLKLSLWEGAPPIYAVRSPDRSAGSTVRLAPLLVTALCWGIAAWLGWLGRRTPLGIPAVLAMGGLIVTGRLVALEIAGSHADAGVFGYSHYASRALGIFSRSPFDLFLTAGVILALGSLLVRYVPRRHSVALAVVFTAAGIPLLAQFVRNLVLNSRISSIPEHILPESVSQSLLTLSLVLLGMVLVRRWPGLDTNRRRLLYAVVCTGALLLTFYLARPSTVMGRALIVMMTICIFGNILTSVIRRDGARLRITRAVVIALLISPGVALFDAEAARRVVSEVRAPLVMGESGQLGRIVETTIERIERVDITPHVPEGRDAKFPEDLAWAVWRESTLARLGTPSSIEIRDLTGRRVSRFGTASEAELEGMYVVERHVPVVRSGDLVGEARVVIADPVGGPTPVGQDPYYEYYSEEHDPLLAATERALRHTIFDASGNPASPPGFRLARSAFYYSRHLEPGESVWARASAPQNLDIYLREGTEALYAFPVQVSSAGDEMRRAGSLAMWALALVLLFSTPALSDRLGGVGSFRLSGVRFQARLSAAMALVVIVPFLAIGIFLRVTIADRFEEEFLFRGQDALDAAQRVMEDYLGSRTDLEPELALDDSILEWLAGVVGHDLHLFRDGRLAASSRRDLFTARVEPSILPGSVYSAIVFEGAQSLLEVHRVREREYAEIYSPMAVVPGEDWVLGLPLVVQAKEIDEQIDDLSTNLSLLVVAILTIAALISGWVSRSISRPVGELADAARQIGRGNLSPAISRPSDPDFRVLATTFDEMARSIGAQQGDLRLQRDRLRTLIQNIDAAVVLLDEHADVLEFNAAAERLFDGRPDGEAIRQSPFAEVIEQPSATSRMFIELIVRKADEDRSFQISTIGLPASTERMVIIEDVTDIVRSNRLKAWAEMARQVAHDIKNPLTPIQLTAEHLENLAERGDENLREAVRSGSRNILRQVETLRETSRAFGEYSANEESSFRETAPAVLLEQIASGYNTGDRLRVDLEAEGLPSSLRGDPASLQRAVINLIENALHATDIDSPVRLKARRLDDGMVEICVEDDGPGVPEEYLSKIFDPYFSTKSGGTGLGLANARKIVERHGGTIRAENTNPGLRISITLPVDGSVPRRDPQPPSS